MQDFSFFIMSVDPRLSSGNGNHRFLSGTPYGANLKTFPNAVMQSKTAAKGQIWKYVTRNDQGQTGTALF